MRLEKLVSLLKLARILSSDWEGKTIDEMADILGVSRRTAERMRDAIEEAFGPLDIQEEGRSKRFRLPARGIDRFVRSPTIDELTELENAARALEPRDPVRAAHLHSLRDKIGASLRETGRRAMAVDLESQLRGEAIACQAGPRPLSDTAVLSVLREAILMSKVVRFDYGGDAKNSPRWRKVVPYGLIFGPRYYLVAGIEGRDGEALYRLDQIHNLAITDEPGAPPEEFNLKAYAERSFGIFQEEPETIVLRFSPESASDAKSYLFHPTQSLAEQMDGSLIVSFRAGALLQIVHHLMTWGNAVTILEPPRLRALMRSELETLHAQHFGEPG